MKKLKAFLTSFIALTVIFGTFTVNAQSNKYGDDEATCKKNISLYHEYYKQWRASNYQNSEIVASIVEPWRYCLQHCPLSREGLYVDGVAIMRHFVNNETDAEKKERYIDTLSQLFDLRAQYFPSKKGKSQIGNIMWRKAAELFTVAPERIDVIYEAAKKSVDADGDNADDNAIIYLFSATVGMVSTEQLEKSVIIDTYDRVSAIIDKNISKYEASNNSKQSDRWREVKDQVEKQFEPFASCEDLINIFQVKFEKDPENLELLKKITQTLNKNKCTDSDLFLQATQNLFAQEPTKEAAFLMSKIHIRNGEFEKAYTSLLDVVELNDENESPETLDLEADAELLLGQVCLNLKKFVEGREHARRSLKIRPDNGSPLIIIGDLYAASSNLCDEDEIEKKAVFWVAVDKYNEAKRKDPGLTEECNKKIALYSQYFPSSGAAFFHDYTDGMTYKVGCWINESTIVRTIKQ